MLNQATAASKLDLACHAMFRCHEWHVQSATSPDKIQMSATWIEESADHE